MFCLGATLSDGGETTTNTTSTTTTTTTSTSTSSSRSSSTSITTISNVTRGVAIKSGLGGRNRRVSAENFFLHVPPISAFFFGGGDLMTYHCTGQKTFKTQRKQYI